LDRISATTTGRQRCRPAFAVNCANLAHLEEPLDAIADAAASALQRNLVIN
jgi:hypothetical protein